MKSKDMKCVVMLNVPYLHMGAQSKGPCKVASMKHEGQEEKKPNNLR
jgi:hypothetical protein